MSPSCCRSVVKQYHRRFPLDSFRVASLRCGVTIVPTTRNHSRVSLGVISNSWVFRTPRSRRTHWPRNASGRSVTSLLTMYLALLVKLDLFLGDHFIQLFHLTARWSCDTLVTARRFFLCWRDSTYLVNADLRTWSRTQKT